MTLEEAKANPTVGARMALVEPILAGVTHDVDCAATESESSRRTTPTTPTTYKTLVDPQLADGYQHERKKEQCVRWTLLEPGQQLCRRRMLVTIPILLQFIV